MKTYHLWIAYNNNGYILGMSVNKGALIKLFPNCKFNYVEFTNNNILSYSDLIR